MENPEPRAQYLNAVLRQIERTNLRIPRFQRHFVWGERHILELLESVKRGYPIGSILTWRVEARDGYFSGFRTNPFPEPNSGLASFEVVLDGAQRLSSLYGCLKQPDSGEVYRVHYDAREQSFAHTPTSYDLEQWQVPMHALFDSRQFLEVQAQVAKLQDGEELLSRTLDLYSTFQDYQIPIIALSGAELEDVVEVFRRVNSSGTPLSDVDFVRALTWRSNFDLEESFDSIAEEFQGSPLEGISDEYLTRCLAITSNLPLDAREVIRLRELSKRTSGLTRELERMKEALERLARFLDSISVEGIKEVPYEGQRLLLFATMAFKPEMPAEQLEQWLWQSTFAEEHQSKPESYLSRQVRAIRDGDLSAAFDVRKVIDPALFATRSRRAGSAVTTGFDLLLRKTEARSLLSGERLHASSGMYAPIFSSKELGRAAGGGSRSTSVLANLIWLTPQDATHWRNLQETRSAAQIRAHCQETTGDAAAIWESQGLGYSEDLFDDPALLLRARSEDLLRRVVRFMPD